MMELMKNESLGCSSVRSRAISNATSSAHSTDQDSSILSSPHPTHHINSSHSIFRPGVHHSNSFSSISSTRSLLNSRTALDESRDISQDLLISTHTLTPKSSIGSLSPHSVTRLKSDKATLIRRRAPTNGSLDHQIQSNQEQSDLDDPSDLLPTNTNTTTTTTRRRRRELRKHLGQTLSLKPQHPLLRSVTSLIDFHHNRSTSQASSSKSKRGPPTSAPSDSFDLRGSMILGFEEFV